MHKGCWIAMGVGGVLVLGSCAILGKIAFSFYDFGEASRELPAAVKAYRAAGLPFVASDVVPPAPIPAEDATPALREALAAMPKGKVEADLATALKDPGPAADPVLAAYAKSLALVDGALGRPRIDYHRDWDLGPYILFPEYAKLKTLSKAASLSAVRAAQKGDDATALRSLSAARQIARWAEQEPTMISMLVRISVESIALRGAEQCLDAAAARPEQIARYAQWLADAPPLPDFGHALRGEAFMGVTTGRNFANFGGLDAMTAMGDSGSMPKVDPRKLRREGLPDDNRTRGFMARHLQLWTQAARETNNFTAPPIEIGQRMDAIAQQAEAQRGLSYVLTRIMFPVFAQAGEAITTLEARRAVQKGFAEALDAHARTGRWPATVGTFDPFTKRPLLVRKDGAGLRVYSVGRDRKDDGGFLKRELTKMGKKGDDLVAAYPAISP